MKKAFNSVFKNKSNQLTDKPGTLGGDGYSSRSVGDIYKVSALPPTPTKNRRVASHYSSQQIDLQSPSPMDSLKDNDNDDNNSKISKLASFERQDMSSSRSKVIKDGFMCEKSVNKNEEIKRMKTNEGRFEEKSIAKDVKARLETNDLKATKVSKFRQDERSTRIGDVCSSESKAFMSSESVSSVSSESYKKETSSRQVVTKSVKSSVSTSHNPVLPLTHSDAVPIITEPPSSPSSQYPTSVSNETLSDISTILASLPNEPLSSLKRIYNIIEASLHHSSKSSSLLSSSADIINDNNHIKNSIVIKFIDSKSISCLISLTLSDDLDIAYYALSIIERIFTIKLRDNLLESSEFIPLLSQIMEFSRKSSFNFSRLGIKLIEKLSSENGPIKELLKNGALNVILAKCQNITTDVHTYRACAVALANLSLYGDEEDHEILINGQIGPWLFLLATNIDDEVRYYGILTIAILLSNKEIETCILSSGNERLIDNFLNHSLFDGSSRISWNYRDSWMMNGMLPKINVRDSWINGNNICSSNNKLLNDECYGYRNHSLNWLKKLAKVLESDRDDVKSMAAFHFSIEARRRKKQNSINEINDSEIIDKLRRVASSPNALASKFAAQALKSMGQEVPHKLSQQVPLWTVNDVKEWVKQIGFSKYIDSFESSLVDGDILLQLNETMLKDDIKISNGILRRRFIRELANLKRMADYSSCDTSNLSTIIHELGPTYGQYIYNMIQSGIDSENIYSINEQHLLEECQIHNAIHRSKILQHIQNFKSRVIEEGCDSLKPLDVFISYRRSNGSQLASLLKVHLQLRGFSVFIDIERLEAGKFDSNLCNSIKRAKHFMLVLTPNSLDRCSNDEECKDWVHREIYEALQNKCNIIPILDNFQWPEPETLPEDIRAVCYFNGVSWIHEYQDACIDRLERFIRGEMDSKNDSTPSKMSICGTPGTPSIKSPYSRAGSIDGLKLATDSS